MSVSSSTAKVSYTLTTGSQALTVPFRFLSNSHVKAVKAGDSPITLVENTDYTLTGAGSASGTLTTIATVGNGLAAGSIVVIKRNVPLTQETSYSYNGDFSSSVQETVEDKLTMIAQQLNEKADRALHFPEDDTTSAQLASKTDRAGKVQGYDSTGAPSLYSATNATTVTIQTTSISDLRSLNIANISNNTQAQCSGYYYVGDGGGGPIRFLDKTRTAGFYTDNGYSVIVPTGGDGSAAWITVWSGPIHSKWAGVKSDGVSDDTVALQRIIDCCTYGIDGIKKGTDVILSVGTTIVSNTIFLGYPHPNGSSYGYVKSVLRGEATGGADENLPILKSNFSSLDRPVIAVESGRGSGVQGIAIYGQLDDSLIAINLFDPNVFRNNWFSRAGFENAEISAQSANKRRYSPYAGIVFNAYSGANAETSPAPYPIVSIPSYLQNGIGAATVQYGKKISAGSFVIDVTPVNLDVGVLMNAFSDWNGDRNILENIRPSRCVYGISGGARNQRQFNVSNSHFTGCYIAVCDNVHGYGQGRLYSLNNCELNYCCFWVTSNNLDGVYLKNCYSEGGGQIGEFVNVTLDSCVHQVVTYNCYLHPIIKASESCLINRLSLQGGNVSGVGNYFSKAFPIPFVFQCARLNVSSIFIYDMAVDEFGSGITHSFIADIDSFTTSTVEDENKIVYAMTRYACPAFINVPYIESKGAYGESVTDVFGSIKILTGGGNKNLSSSSYYIPSATAATLSQRYIVPVYFRNVSFGTSSEYSTISNVSIGNGIGDLDFSTFTQVETTDSFTDSGDTFGLRNLYIDAIWNPNSNQRAMRKGWMYYGTVDGKPFIMVAVKNPTETGVANKWRFKVIYGYDGRSENSIGITIPASGYAYDYFSEIKPTRVLPVHGQLRGSVTSGSNTLTINTEYGVDATKLFAVGDVVTSKNQHALFDSGNGTSSRVYASYKVTAIPASNQVTMSRNAANTVSDFEIEIN